MEITFTATLDRFEDNGIHFVWVPGNITPDWLTTHGRRTRCRVCGVWFHAPLLPKGGGNYFIIISQPVRKAGKLKPGDSVTVTMAVDETPFQSEMPDELAEVLSTDPEAEAVFQTLTPGRQRRLLWLVRVVKSPDKRIDRALRIASFLRAGQTDVRHIQLFINR